MSPRINLLEEDNPKPGEEGVDDHQGHAEAHPACIRQRGNSLAIGAVKVIIVFIIKFLRNYDYGGDKVWRTASIDNDNHTMTTTSPVQDVENNEIGRAARDDPGASDVGGVRHREEEEVSSHLQSCG